MREFKVYLAGPISGLTFEGSTDWRDYAKRKLSLGPCLIDNDGDGDCPTCDPRKGNVDPLCRDQTGIVGYSPMRAKDYLKSMGVITGRPEAYEDYILSSAKGILYRDAWDCATADLILVNLMGATQISVGTVMEIGMGWANRKPIVVAMEEDNAHAHPMINTAVGWICPDLDYAIDVTKAILLPDGIKVAA